MTALKLMMPPQSGAEQALGPMRDDFVLRPEELQWSEQDFLGGKGPRALGGLEIDRSLQTCI